MTVMVSYLRSRGIDRVLEDSSGNAGASLSAYAAAERAVVPHPGAGDGVVPEDRADRRVRRRRRHDPRHAAGRRRRGAPPERRDLLREPQLAAVLRGGREDPRVRAVGAARLQTRPTTSSCPSATAATCSDASAASTSSCGGARSVAGRVSSASRPRTARPTTRRSAPAWSTSCPRRSRRPWPRASRRPSRRGSREVLRAVRESGGGVVAVDEAEIVEALAALARKGFYVEPTSAAAAAGLGRLLDERRDPVRRDDRARPDGLGPQGLGGHRRAPEARRPARGQALTSGHFRPGCRSSELPKSKSDPGGPTCA